MSCRRSSRFWGLGCPKIFHEIEDSLVFPDEQARIVKLLVEKVIVSLNDIEVRLQPNGIERLALEFGQTTGEALA